MILNEYQQKEFEEAVRPLMEFLSNNCHPHAKATVCYSRAELFEGVVSFVTEDYVKD